MINLKKIAIIAAIAVLSSILIFSIINAVYEKPDYSRVCPPTPYYLKPVMVPANCTDIQPSAQAQEDCNKRGGYLEPIQGENGCASEYGCNTCNTLFEKAQEKYNFVSFILSSVFGLIFIMASTYMKYESESLKEWILPGLLIGGIAAIFVGTGEYFRDMHRLAKPAIIFAEIVLVIFIGYKKIGSKEK